MKRHFINGKYYELVKDFNEGFDFAETESKLTDYFDEYDYIFGDWAYGKLRLKGFFDSTNQKKRDHNDISNMEHYLKENCAYGCRHFLLKKSV
jgi:uncharacterized protein YutD